MNRHQTRTCLLRGVAALGAVFCFGAVGRADVVTWYAFDDNLLDTAAAGAGANNLTARIVGGAGAETYEPGIIGNAVRVDLVTGTAYALQAPDAADLRLATEWTLEAFIKPDFQNIGEWDRFWTKWGEGSNDWHFTMRYPQDGLDLFVNGGNNVINGNSGQPANRVPLDRWSHIAMVGNSADNSIRAYINGAQVASAAYVGVVGGTGNMNFGNFAATAPNDLQWTGLVDDAKIHNAAVDATYLQSRAALIPPPPPPGYEPPPASGLVSYWTFEGTTDDVAGSQPQNVGMVADNFTPRGGIANYEAGQVGQALRIGVNPGDTTDLAAALSADVQLPATYSIEMWVKPTELADAWQRLVLNWGGEFAYHFAIRNNGGYINGVSLFHGEADGGQPNVNGGTVVLNQWQHLAGVADGSLLHVYLNGEQVAAAPYDGTIHAAAVEGLGLGDSFASLSTIKFNGYVDDLAIWNVPLTPEQIRFQYQQGLGGLGATVPEPSAWLLAAMAGLGGVALRWRKRRS